MLSKGCKGMALFMYVHLYVGTYVHQTMLQNAKGKVQKQCDYIPGIDERDVRLHDGMLTRC